MKGKLLKIFLIILAILILMVVAGVVVNSSNQRSAERNAEKLSTATKVSENINFSVINTTSSQEYTIKFKEGESMLDLMNQLEKDDKSFTFETETSDFGEYVVTINGVSADKAKKEFWALFVNGTESTTGVSDYKPKFGDEVDFILSNY